MRFATFDIESTALEASFGRLLCACFKFLDEDKPRCVQAHRYRNEKAALEKLVTYYDAADVVITWYGSGFDIPFINARLMHHGLLPLRPKMHKDIMYEARKLRLRGSRLENVSKDFKTKTKKYDVPAWQWTLAAEGDRKAHDEILKHCIEDVLLTEEMFHRLKPLIIKITKLGSQ
jgi:uncharacterized protein YprB with RNaseH-like and TPR domain